MESLVKGMLPSSWQRLLELKETLEKHVAMPHLVEWGVHHTELLKAMGLIFGYLLQNALPTTTDTAKTSASAAHALNAVQGQLRALDASHTHDLRHHWALWNRLAFLNPLHVIQIYGFNWVGNPHVFLSHVRGVRDIERMYWAWRSTLRRDVQFLEGKVDHLMHFAKEHKL